MLGILTLSKSSCYLDSFLVALFHTPNEYVQKHIMQHDIAQMKTSYPDALTTLRQLGFGIQHCAPTPHLNTLRDQFRAQLQSIHPHTRTFTSGPLDVSEVWEVMDSVCQPTDHLECIVSLHVTADLSSGWEQVMTGSASVPVRSNQPCTLPNSITLWPSEIVNSAEQKHRPQQYVDIVTRTTDTLLQANSWFTHHGTAYPRVIKVSRIEAAEYLFVLVNRVVQAGQGAAASAVTKLQSAVRLPPHIQPSRDGHRRLTLRSVIVHAGSSASNGHYTTYLQRDEQWFVYDNNKFPHVYRWGVWAEFKGCTPVWQNVSHAFYC
jgi:hypothetical protein